MRTPPAASFNLATYLDSDSDDSDHIHYEGKQEEEWPAVDHNDLVEPT